MSPNEQTEVAPEPRPVRDAAKHVASDGAEVLRQAGQVTREEIKKPTTAAGIAGAVAMGAAVSFGVLETAVGGAAAYVTYRVLRRRRAEAAGA